MNQNIISLMFFHILFIATTYNNAMAFGFSRDQTTSLSCLVSDMCRTQGILAALEGRSLSEIRPVERTFIANIKQIVDGSSLQPALFHQETIYQHLITNLSGFIGINNISELSSGFESIETKILVSELVTATLSLQSSAIDITRGRFLTSDLHHNIVIIKDRIYAECKKLYPHIAYEDIM
jgi:hypothetical protein